MKRIDKRLIKVFSSVLGIFNEWRTAELIKGYAGGGVVYKKPSILVEKMKA